MNNFLLPIIIFLSCSMETYVSVRTVLNSGANEPLEIKIYTENSYGMIVDGSLVLVTNPAGVIQLANFSSNDGSYESLWTNPISGNYTIEVHSNIQSKAKKIVVPHQVLTETADIISIMDNDGNSVLNGDDINGDLDISVGWEEVPGATVYQLSLISGLNTIYTMNTSNTAVILPRGTIPSSGSYAFYVLSQYQSGDPFLRNEVYSSASSSRSASVYFNTVVSPF